MSTVRTQNTSLSAVSLVHHFSKSSWNVSPFGSARSADHKYISKAIAEPNTSQ